MTVKDLWKYAFMVNGELSASMDGDLMMLVLCAGNLDMHLRV